MGLAGSPADIIELHELAARYGDIIDARDWDALGTVFVEDLVYDVSDIRLGVVHGLEALKQYMRQDGIHPEGHLILNIYVEAIDGPRGRMRSRLLAVQRDGTVATGAYVDDVVHVAGAWRIKQRVFTYKRRPKV
jgi:hypothetical protein